MFGTEPMGFDMGWGGRWMIGAWLIPIALVLAGAVVAGIGGCSQSRLSGSDSGRALGLQTAQAQTMPSGMRGGCRMQGCGPGMRGRGMRGGRGHGMGGSMLRHRQAMMNGIPADYAGLRNPLPATAEVIAAGETLYQANCAACHGSGGAGDGPAGEGLVPRPANLRRTLRRPFATDSYLLWAISEGGAASGTGMPAFADALSQQDRWRIIRYLRSL